MQEIEIIRGEKINTKLITLFIVVLGIIVFAIVWNAKTSSGFYYERLDDIEYVWTSMVPYFGSMTFLPFLLLALIFYFWTSKMNVIVTNKRVYGISAFGMRIDLPLDKISSVSTSFFKGIGVTTSSGIVKFRLFKNNIELHSRINELLIKRQDIMEQNSEKIILTSADELKKRKELLDNGAIGQNMAGTMNGIMSNINQTQVEQTPPPIPVSKYYVVVNGQSTGPFDLKTLENMADKGEFSKESLVWKKGMANWVKAETIDELNGLFTAIPPIPNN